MVKSRCMPKYNEQRGVGFHTYVTGTLHTTDIQDMVSDQ
jgi:hypothetical protein